MGRSEKHLADQYGQERARWGGGKRRGGVGSQTDVERDTPRPRGAREEVGGGRRGEGESLQGTACAIQEYCYPPESVSAGTSHSAPSLGHGGEGRGRQDWWWWGGRVGRVGRMGDVTGVSREGEERFQCRLTDRCSYLFILSDIRLENLHFPQSGIFIFNFLILNLRRVITQRLSILLCQ